MAFGRLNIGPRMRMRPIVALCDLWIGVFIDAPKRRIYVMPVPCIGVVVEWGEPWD